MGKESETDSSQNELNARIALSRERVEYDLRGLQHELDFVAKLRWSYVHRTAYWVGGATAAGMLLALLAMREKKVYVAPEPNGKRKDQLASNGFALGALNLAAGLIRPAITEFVKDRLGQSPRRFR